MAHNHFSVDIGAGAGLTAGDLIFQPSAIQRQEWA
jgi:hypothetical protein